MATKYDNFALFMADVVDETHKKVSKYEEAWSACLFILRHCGWAGFIAVCALLILNVIGFSAAIVPFLLSPVGIAIAAIGGAAVLWTLWRNKVLPLAVKKCGQEFKSRWEAASPSEYRVDQLRKEAIEYLYNELMK